MVEAEKEMFRRYLETSGVIDTITSILARLYDEEEKPEKALDFLKSSLGAPTLEEYEKLNNEKREIEIQLEKANETVANLQQKIADLESGKKENFQEPIVDLVKIEGIH